MKPYLIISVIIAIGLAIIGSTLQSSYGASSLGKKGEPAVIATSGENVYVVWGKNDTAGNNSEVMFRVSEDGGQSYTDKINLSNSSSSNSTDFDIKATGNNVIVSWWETNATSAEPVIISSSDNGATFGPVLKLATNGTIGRASE